MSRETLAPALLQRAHAAITTMLGDIASDDPDYAREWRLLREIERHLGARRVSGSGGGVSRRGSIVKGDAKPGRNSGGPRSKARRKT